MPRTWGSRERTGQSSGNQRRCPKPLPRFPDIEYACVRDSARKRRRSFERVNCSNVLTIDVGACIASCGRTTSTHITPICFSNPTKS